MLSWCHFSAMKTNALPPSSTKKGKTFTYMRNSKSWPLPNYSLILYIYSLTRPLRPYHWANSYLWSINILNSILVKHLNLISYISLGCTLPLSKNWLLLTSTAHYPNSPLAWLTLNFHQGVQSSLLNLLPLPSLLSSSPGLSLVLYFLLP